jgi:hypothetical protein
MAGPINPSVANYASPQFYDGTQIPLPAGYITAYELRISAAADMASPRVIRDASPESAATQTTPIPTDLTPGQWYADIAGVAGTVVQKRGKPEPFMVERIAEPPRNFSLA